MGRQLRLKIDLKLMFDDPDLVDAEPVAVYARKIYLNETVKDTSGSGAAAAEFLGQPVPDDAFGSFMSTAVDKPTFMGDLPVSAPMGDRGRSSTLRRLAPLTTSNLRGPARSVRRSGQARIAGVWELIEKAPVKDGVVSARLPVNTPTVLAGFDKSGHVVRWETQPRDSRGDHAVFYALAGDHYSLARSGSKTFCVGCHPGHSGVPTNTHKHAEIMP